MPLEIKKHRDRYELNLFHSKGSGCHYHSIIDKDPKKLAQVLIDLKLDGYPIDKAVRIMRERISKKDWIGF